MFSSWGYENFTQIQPANPIMPPIMKVILRPNFWFIGFMANDVTNPLTKIANGTVAT